MYGTGKKMDLDKLFHPRSVALIGASTEQNKLSGRPIRYFREFGYTGGLYPINPKYREIAGLPCYAKLADVPGEVDLAVITLPASAVPAALAACGAKGVKAAAVISSGFAEVGGEGVELQEKLRRIAAEHDIAVCGPNCSGFVYVPEKVTASFSVGLHGGFPESGPAAFVSQSGALSSYILGAARARGLGFRYWITTGNECVLSFTDYLHYILEDPDVRLVLGYVEDVRDGAAFQNISRRALALDKPLIIMKTGRSEAGARASVSHTGSLAGADEVYQAVFAQNGVLRAENLDELFDLAAIAQAPRRPRGNRVQVVSISGAAGILMADTGADCGLEFTDLDEATKQELRGIMPPFASIANPMDVTAEAVARPELLRQAAEVIVKDPNVDSLVIFYGIVPGAHEKLAKDMAQVAADTDKLVMVTWFPLPAPEIWKALAHTGVPVFSEPARGIRALGKMVQYAAAQARARARQPASEKPAGNVEFGAEAGKIFALANGRNRKVATEFEVKQLLKACGFTVPRGGLARTASEAEALAAEIDGPVAMKAISPQLAHKSEAGVVRLNVSDPTQAKRIFAELVARAKTWSSNLQLDGVLVEEMIVGETREVMIGARQDLRFGPVVTFALGGIWVEAMQDFSVWPAPLTIEEARAAIRRLRGYRTLTAFRGRPAADLEAIAGALCRLGDIACRWREQIAEIEINPLFVLPEGSGVIVGDALATMNPDPTK